MSDDEYGGGGGGDEFEYEGGPRYAHPPHLHRLNNLLNQYHSDLETRPLSVTLFFFKSVVWNMLIQVRTTTLIC